jgi:hypothetical protein
MGLKEKKQYYFNHPDLLLPLLNIDSTLLAPSMVYTVCQGILLPTNEAIAATAMENLQTIVLMVDNLSWIKKVINGTFIDDSLHEHLIAQPNAVGEDAFIAAWEKNGQPFQLVVTRDRLHLLTKKPLDAKDVPDDLKSYAFYCIERYLNVNLPVDRDNWNFRTLGDVLLGYREFTFFRLWEHTIIFLTDGNGIKISIMKREGETHTPQRHEGNKNRPVWFLRDERK